MAKTILSASKIKTLQSCSWTYFCKYILKLPDRTNLGAQLGSIAHIVFEVLGNPRHQKQYKRIIKNKNIFASLSVKRLVLKHLFNDDIYTQENEDKLKQMILTGLNADFHGLEYGKPAESISEFEFNISHKCENLEYNIKGFIDKLFIYDKKIIIKDFKTSKKAFDGKDASSNLQDYLYCLAIKKTYPNIKDIDMHFLFLKDGVLDGYDVSNSSILIDGCSMKMAGKSDDELIGFQYELNDIQKYADNFSEKTATSNLAAKQPFPKDGSFSGPLLCGFAKFPGQIKKDGNPMWHCSFKFAFSYFVLLDDKKEIIKSSFEKKDLLKIKTAKQSVEQREYSGCPHFNKKN